MEAATIEFIRGLRYTCASVRCRTWAGDGLTESRLQRLADTYSERGCSLMLGEEVATAPLGNAVAGREPWGNPATGASRGGDDALW